MHAIHTQSDWTLYFVVTTVYGQAAWSEEGDSLLGATLALPGAAGSWVGGIHSGDAVGAGWTWADDTVGDNLNTEPGTGLWGPGSPVGEHSAATVLGALGLADDNPAALRAFVCETNFVCPAGHVCTSASAKVRVLAVLR